MGAEMDRLEIAVESQASKANQQLDLMIKRLSRVAGALTGIESRGLSELSGGVRNLGSAVKTMDATKTAEISKMARQLSRLTKVDLSSLGKVVEPVKAFSSAMESLADLSGISSPKLDAKNINSVTSALEKLSGINMDAEKLTNIAASLKALSGLSDLAIPELDTKNLSSIASVIGKLSRIEPGSLPQVAEGLEKVTRSIALLGNVDLKDTGVNHVVNALNRLFKTDFGKFRPEAFEKITRSVSSLAKIPDVSNSLNRFLSSLSKLANAGDKAKTVAAELPVLGSALQKAVNKMANAKDISESVNLFVQSIGRLAGAGAKTGKTADQLKELAEKTLEFFRTMEKAPQISENTIRMTEALARLASAGGKINTATKSVSSSFDKLSKVSKNASGIISGAFHQISQMGKKAADALKSAFSNISKVVEKSANAIKSAFGKIAQGMESSVSGIKRAASEIASAFAKVTGSSSGLNTASLSLGSIIKAAAGFKSAKGLLNFGKSAIDLGSDITEVENVVDTAFGSMANMAYEFASTATEKFGLSELAAKQYSGTMMAMLKSSGVAQGAAAEMSTTMAGLAGDIASFYNIDTDEAFYKLRAAIAGETEPMKALGVNMNIVNLEAYAMSQGITKAYKDMTLAEQSILRYNYLLAKTGDAQGDFARTAGTWANQVRLLRLNIQSISAVIGQGLIAAILPTIKLLNKFMSKLMQAAKVFRDFMYVLTGKKLEGSSQGVVNDLAGITDSSTDLSGIGDSAEEVSDGMEDASESMDDASVSAKKLKKALTVLPIDQLNQLNSNLDDLGYSLSNKKGKDPLDDLNLDEAGLGDMSDLFDDLNEKTEIEPINEWARRIREAFLNHDWEGLGKTIAEMINLGLRKIYDTIKKITPKVEKALRAFAKVFNSFVKWLDWDLLGRTIGAGINLLARAFNALFGPGGIDLEQLGRKLSVGFRGMVDEIEWRRLGNAIGNGFMIAWRIASGFVEDMWRINPDTLLTGWAETGIALAEGIHGIFERINFAQIGKTLADGFNGITEIIRNFRDQMADNSTWSMIAKNISDGFNNLFEVDLAGFAQQASGLALDILYMLNDAAERTNWNDFGYRIADALFSIPWLTLFNQVFDFVSATFGEALGGFINYMTTHAEQLGQSFADMFNTLFAKIQYIASNIPWDDLGTAISTFLNTAIAKIRPGQAVVSLGNFVTSLLGTMLQVAEETRWDDLGRKIGNFLMMIPWQTIIGQVFDTITSIFGGLITGLGGSILAKMPEIGTALANGFNYAFEKLRAFVGSVEWTDIGQGIANGLNNMIHGINWGDAGKTLSDFVKSLLNVFFTVAQETDWEALGKGIGDFLDNIDWLGILGGVIGTIGSILGGLIDGLKETTSGNIVIALGKLWLKVQAFGLVDKVKDVVSKVAQAFGLLPKGVTDAIPGIGGGVEKIAGAGGLFSKLASGLPGIVSKIGSLLGSIGSVIFSPQGLMIAGIVAGVALIIANWDSIKKAAGEIWGAVKTAVTDVWEGLKTAAGDIWGGITTLITDTWSGIKTGASDIWEGIKTYLSDVWSGIQTVAGDVWSGITTVVSDAWEMTNTITHDTWDGITTFLGDTWEGLKTIANDTWNGITTGISDIWGGLKTMAGDVWGAITGQVSDANSGAESNTATTWGNTRESMHANLQAMAAAAQSAMESIKDTVNASMAEITATYTMQWQVIAGATQEALQQTQTVVTVMMQSLKGIITISIQEISAIFNSGWQAVSTISATAIEMITTDITAKMAIMQTTIGTIMQQVAETFQVSWKAIGEASFIATETMLEDVTTKMSAMCEAVNINMDAIHIAFQDKWNDSKTVTIQTLRDVETAVITKMDSVRKKVDTVMRDIQTFFKKWEDIGKVCDGALKAIEKGVSDKMESIKRTIESVMKDACKAFDKWKDMSNTCANALKDTEETVSRKMGDIKTAVENSMKNIFTAYKNGLKDFPSTARETVRNVVDEFSKLPSKIASSFDGLFNAGRNAAQSFANGFRSVHIPTPHIFVSSWTEHRAGTSRYSTPNFGINWYAKGGLFTRPTIAGFGEAGDEAALPLENQKVMRKISKSILANAPQGSMENIKEDIKQAVIEGIVEVMINNGSQSEIPQYIQNSIYLDGDVMALAVTKAQKDNDYRFNPVPQY